MARKSLTSGDRRVAFGKNNALNNVAYGTTEQVVSITDIISEGPIGGLVQGGKSIYLDNDPIFDDEDTGYSSISGESVSGTASSTSVTINEYNAEFAYNPEGVADATTYLGVFNLYEITDNLSFSSSAIEGNTGFAVGTQVTVTWGGTNDPATATLPTSLITTYTSSTRYIALKSLADGIGYAHLIADDDRSLVGLITSITQPSAGNSYQGTLVISVKSSLESLTWLDNATTLRLEIAQYFSIDTISNGVITLTSATPAIDFSNKSFVITKPQYQETTSSSGKYESTTYQFRPGVLDQKPIETLQGVGSSTVSLTAPGTSMARGTEYTITATGAQAAEIDSVSLIFNYPGGLYLTNTEKGTKEPAGAGYIIELAVSTGSGAYGDYVQLTGNQDNISAELAAELNTGGTVVSAGDSLFSHGGKFTSAVSFTHVINLEDYQPFVGFRLRVTRVTNSENITDLQSGRGHVWPGLGWRGPDIDKWQAVQGGGISQVLGVIKEKLNYPYTALANVTFNARNFANTPARTYECYGLKVLVPNNYTTREQLGLTNGVFPNVDEMYNGIWTGTFADKKVYTDNPAWVFYDILTNNRYGIGEFIQDSEIDKYSLYKIARYCDELVPDGKGGLEPRFRANIYLQKATDVYKVLKDMATTFRGMLYWMDGQLTPVIDEKKAPIYNFNRSNVVGGSFEYQGTSARTRTNQVVVSWNNPDSDYKLEPLIVEDRENIVSTGKLVKETATAFGCTSEGQAIRYGRWKLWTGINQTEIVSFKTAINAAFLAPGDVINIQDNHDFGFAYSGRIVSAASSTSIVLDRQTDASANDTIALLIPTSEVVLSQATADINSTTYYSGDAVTFAYDEDGTQITFSGTDEQIEQKIHNAYDDSGNIISLQYNKETVVREVLISSIDGDGVTLTLGTAISEYADLPGMIWGIKEATPTAASYKQYRIVSITQENDNAYGITAIEYYESKFDTIENNFITAVADPVYPTEVPEDKVPAPSGLRILRTPKFTSPGEEILLGWDAPSDSSNIAGYEISCDIPGYPATIFTNSTSYFFDKVPDGRYTFYVRSITLKNRKSRPATESVYIEDIFGGNWPRIFGLVQGGYVSAPVTIDTTAQTLKFETDPVYFYPFTSTATSSTNFTGLSLDYSSLASTSTAYLFVDMSATAIKLINYSQDTTLGVDYWYDQVAYNASAASIWTGLTGTVSVSANSSKVTGSGTSFLSELAVTNIIKFSSTQAARIAYIESDTVLYIDKVFDTAISGASADKDALNPDYTQDFIAGKLSDTGAWQTYLTLDPDIARSRSLTVTVNPNTLTYDTNESQTNATAIEAEIVALNYSKPEFNISTTAGLVGDSNTGWVSGNNGAFAYDFTVDTDGSVAYDSNSTQSITVQVRESQDPSNTDYQKSSTVVLSKVKDGADGAEGPPGADGAEGPPGDPGADGLRTAEGYVYYNVATSTAPTGPGTSATYTWSTGAITGMNANWQQSPPEMTAGAQGKYYYARYTVIQSASTDTTNTPSFGSVTLGHNFTGLVTFSSGDFEQDGATITQIDGGRIATDTITATQIQISNSTGSSTAGIEMDYNSGNPRIKIHDGTSTRVILGYLL